MWVAQRTVRRLALPAVRQAQHTVRSSTPHPVSSERALPVCPTYHDARWRPVRQWSRHRSVASSDAPKHGAAALAASASSGAEAAAERSSSHKGGLVGGVVSAAGGTGGDAPGGNGFPVISYAMHCARHCARVAQSVSPRCTESIRQARVLTPAAAVPTLYRSTLVGALLVCCGVSRVLLIPFISAVVLCRRRRLPLSGSARMPSNSRPPSCYSGVWRRSMTKLSKQESTARWPRRSRDRRL
jgi:hypothetical protein